MTVETFYPQDENLKQSIDYYYCIKTESPDFKTAWYSFPHVNNALSIYQGINYEIYKGKVIISENTNAGFTTLLQAKAQVPLLVQLHGRINRISIIFKPLGLNNFIRQSLSEVIGEESKKFTAWDNSSAYPTLLTNLFAKDIKNQHRVGLLEQFLVSQYQPFVNEKLRSALDLISDFEKDYTIEELAAILSISVRTLNRLFTLHLGISPIGYKRIARFRHSLHNKLFSRQFKKLTQIGYESNFYDQSYFIKMYNKLTGSNPSVLFNSVEKLADNNLILKFIKQ